MDRLAVKIEDKDFSVLREWWRGWGMTPVPRELLPETGMIVPGVCAGFLYLTNSALGLIETYISNPEASKRLRDEGLDELTHALISLAKDHGVTLLRCDSKNLSVIERAKKFQFEELPAGRVLMRRM